MLIHLINADYMPENGGFIINERMVHSPKSGDLWRGEPLYISNTAIFVEEEDIEMDMRGVC